MHNDAGITLTDVHADNQFASIVDPVKDKLGVAMHYPPAGGHVPEAEQIIRVIKERTHASCHRIPCKALPVKAMKVLVMESASKLNYFPNKHGVSKCCRPPQTLHKISLDCEHDCKCHFGQCVKAHEETANAQASRTKEALHMLFIEGGHQR